MLFDLTGKRRKVVQAVFSLLALLFLVSFIGFGIGGQQGGGLFDALGVGSSSSTTAAPDYNDQIEDIKQRLQNNPDSDKLLKELSQLYYTAATQSVGGGNTLTPEEETLFLKSTETWQDYLKTDPKKVDINAASIAAQSYVYLENGTGAVEAQEYVVKESPASANYANLAFYLYADGDFKRGDKIKKKALQTAAPQDRDVLELRLNQIKESALQAKQSEEQSQSDESNPLEIKDPFSTTP